MFIKPKVIAALGTVELNNILRSSDEVEFIFEALNNYDVKERAESGLADTLVTSYLMEDVEHVLPMIKRENPSLRIIYFCRPIGSDDRELLSDLSDMYKEGIWDISFTDTIDEKVIIKALSTVKGPSALSFIEDAENTGNSDIYSSAHELYPGVMDKLCLFMSLKPGSGKSYLAVNTACAIATQGEGNPRVAVIEADLETPSIGTSLGIDSDGGRNIKSALTMIKQLFNGSSLTATEFDQERAAEYVRRQFITAPQSDNLYVLQGTTFMPEDIALFPHADAYYMFLLECIKDDYDVIIVDVSSSINPTTFSMMQKAGKIFCAVTMDANSIRQSLKYKDFITKYELNDKFKWVMTKAMDNTKEFHKMGIDTEKLLITPEAFENDYFKTDFKIPMIPESVFINRIYNGEPVIFDNKAYTKNARAALEALAASVFPLGGNKEVKKGKKGFSLFGK